MYTIEDLKNGKCAVINDGTVEELNKILALIKWPFEASGSEKYYWKESESDSSCGMKDPNLPTQSVKAFIKQLDEGNKLSEIKKKEFKYRRALSGVIKFDNSKEDNNFEEEFTFSEDDIPSNFPYHPYVLDQGIQERCRQRSVSPKKAFDYCIQCRVDSWFTWLATVEGCDYWSHIDCNPKFIPANYTPKYFKSRQSKLPLGGIPLYSVIDSEYQPSNLTKEKKDFTIPVSYIEVELTIKKPICKF